MERIIEGKQVNPTLPAPTGTTEKTPYIDQYVQQAETALYEKYNIGLATVVDEAGDPIAGKAPVDMAAFNALVFPTNGSQPNIAAAYTLLGLAPGSTDNHVNLKFITSGCIEDDKIIRIPISRCPETCPPDDVNGNPGKAKNHQHTDK